MMNYRIIATGLLAASLCIGLPACKKSEPADGGATTAQSLLNTQMNDPKWAKSEVNGLLKYVPADAPFVMASTREMNADSPFIKDLFKRTEKSITSLDNAKALLDKLADKDSDVKMLSEMSTLFKTLMPLYTDYAKNAPEFGLHPLIDDSVMYLDDANLVVKASIANRDKFKAKSIEIIKAVLNISKAGDIIAVETNSDYRTTFSLKDNADSTVAQAKIIVDYGVEAVTAIIPLDPNGEVDVDRIVKPADNPLTKEKLGKIDSSVVGIGYVDNVIAFKKMLSAPTTRELIGELFDMDMTAECGEEASELVAKYPRIDFTYRVVNDKEIHLDSTLVVSDKQELKNIQALHASYRDMSDDKSIMGLNLNFDLGKALDLTVAKLADISTKEYKCKAFNELKTDLSETLIALQSPEMAVVKNVTSKITGVNFALNKIDLSKLDADKIDFEAAFDLGGNDIGSVLSLAKPFMVKAFPQLLALTPNADAPIEIDLSEIISNQKVNVYLTDTDFIVATPNYDIRALAKKSPKSDKTFIAYELNMDFSKQLMSTAASSLTDDESKLFMNSVSAIYDEFAGTMKMSIGTNDNGITYNTTFILK